jgi:hypothetical protein
MKRFSKAAIKRASVQFLKESVFGVTVAVQWTLVFGGTALVYCGQKVQDFQGYLLTKGVISNGRATTSEETVTE